MAKGSLRELKGVIAVMPITVAQEVATEGAKEMNVLLRAAFMARETVYGDSRASTKHAAGKDLSLLDTTATFRTLRFVQEGTVLRCALGTKYAKYLIGKYKILPIGDRTEIPVKWTRVLDEIARIAFERYHARVAA